MFFNTKKKRNYKAINGNQSPDQKTKPFIYKIKAGMLSPGP
jgi:hypothetical protein